MLASMSYRQLKDWRAYFTIVPFTQDRDDLRTGIIASTIVNMLKGKKGKRATAKDFVPKWRKPNKKVDDVFSIARKVDTLRMAFGKQNE